MRVSKRLVDRDTLDVKDQVGVGWDVRRSTPLSVCHGGGNGKTTLTTGSDASDTNIPALDNFPNTELEGERLALLVRYADVSMC